MSSSRPRRSTTLALAAALLAAGLATACDPTGSSDAAPAAPTATTAAPGAATTASPAGKAAAGTVTIDRTAYWGGLRFDIKTAAYTPDPDGSGYKVVLTTTVTNTFRTSPVHYWPDIALDLNGTPVRGDVGTAAPPTPGATNPLPITFTGTGTFGYDGASLVLGESGQAQAAVPLGKGGRPAVTLAPVELKLPTAATITSGRLGLTLKSAELRADVGGGSGDGALTLGQRALKVVFDLNGKVGPAGMAVDGATLRLKLPNGQEVGPTVAPIEAIYPDRPTRQDQVAWFVFQGATDGDYTLSVTDPDNTAAPATATFPATGVKDSGPVN
ncbi:hypothetical protein [Kitasatospora sp. MBT63]|uniref:hypothetical protein n=1 Tax=Kitasatospora sp. MBT63 TaxID=1444768 RepID=UPI00053A6605|nr:hypothetical protein [Kitasatospora sp. MBT63]